MHAPMTNLDLDKTKGRDRTAILVVVIPGLLVLGLLALLVALRDGAEGLMSRLVALLPVSYAFAAGMVASVNPCGVLMLPTYVLYQLGSAGEKRDVLRRVLRGLVVALVVTLGFTTIFALGGGVIAAGGRWLVTAFPYAGLLIGVAMAGLGGWLLVGHQTLGIAAAGRVHLDPKRNLGNMFMFGVVYAIGSLSCTLPIFLVVVGSALGGSSDLGASFGPFLAYAGGMGAVILVVTVGAAVFRRAVSRWLGRFTSYVHRFSAFFLIGGGLYLIYYWIFIADLF
ncbi:MAG: cytochrome c biogenesis CcdA family protein [Anaerolineae bacterium]